MRVGDVRNWVGSPIDGFEPNPIYMYFNCCNCSSYTKSGYIKTSYKKKRISLYAIFLKKEVDWVMNYWVYSSSTFIDQKRDCRCGI